MLWEGGKGSARRADCCPSAGVSESGDSCGVGRVEVCVKRQEEGEGGPRRGEEERSLILGKHKKLLRHRFIG